MTYLVTAWKLNTPGTTHQETFLTATEVSRFIELLVGNTQVDYITIRIVREGETQRLKLQMP